MFSGRSSRFYSDLHGRRSRSKSPLRWRPRSRSASSLCVWFVLCGVYCVCARARQRPAQVNVRACMCSRHSFVCGFTCADAHVRAFALWIDHCIGLLYPTGPLHAQVVPKSAPQLLAVPAHSTPQHTVDTALAKQETAMQPISDLAAFEASQPLLSCFRFRAFGCIRPFVRAQAIAKLAQIFPSVPPSAIVDALGKASGDMQHAAALILKATQVSPLRER